MADGTAQKCGRVRFLDFIVWNENKSIFSFFYDVTPAFIFNAKAVIVPLLIMPQLTHYILDGFIWKISKGHLVK
jgi:hypothetical protein